MSDPPTKENLMSDTQPAEQAQHGPVVHVLHDPPIAAIPDVALAVLRAHLAMSAAAGEPARVDAAAGPDMWESGTVLAHDGPEPDPSPAKALVELDTGERRHLELTELRPHQPCRCQRPDATHPAGDARWCRTAAVTGG